MAEVAALVLAAGAGQRYSAAGGDGPKVLAHLDGRPLLTHVLDRAVQAGLGPLVVVVASAHDTGADVARSISARSSSVRIVVNPDAARGMGTSVAAGLDELGPDQDVRACVVLLADQPGIDPGTIARVVTEWRRSGRPTRAGYEDGPGHPVLLPRAIWATVIEGLRAAGTHPDEGARGFLAGLGAITIDVSGPMPVDIDVPEDLARAAGPADGSA
jgi:molybdenum cofactor cytidylyltransferase